ncbi:MAG: aminotransferase class I/II-fold pyridoxal phosphate-dependent enzyme [Roseitalea sp.]|nr:aminotransferase class I/II-fold pyridoxal phosphate-dependent enzyme [Roseitalea sp.]MBO6951132.1 aminotransferase class I/II-fold pyridoxal phosphate-dependent enzyme [Rhizobiaceae bacterium]MBO6590881.1 aminotransferase class I/II-fold pyridoxal phosphate-dependent enzyme [Roseitalea sp.]MBO6599861.1 aminotransferase class I/II-fold pyridoxal phosphate-dependent enzyme [Roseitalea sp.]MBO6611617.1 aminotransferase class I/II-fold pyridoxal phosphate-dependent enzyme [Roseitalea sp.]
MIRISQRGTVAPFYAMDVLAEANRLAAEGKPVLSLAVGQPGAQAPEAVRRAAANAAMTARLGYTDALGRLETRQAISDHYRDQYGIAVPASRIAVTTGSSAGFSLAFLALSEPGGRVAIASPGYPAYRNIIKALSLEAVELPMKDGDFDLDALLAAHAEKPIDVLLLASPANPTGAVIQRDALGGIVEACRDAGIAFISDEIYHRLRYTGDDVAALAFGDDAIVINSFSKYYCMTGWRIGWMVLPEALVRPVERLAQSLYICAPDLSQIAAARAFACTDDYEVIKQGYEANRKLLLERLPKMGIGFAAQPDGAFYAWCDVSRHTNDSMDFARRMLAEIHVAATPGADFDLFEGERHMRFSYAGPTEAIAEALDRIEAWL